MPELVNHRPGQILGGAGTNLAALAGLGLPVPPGFVLTGPRHAADAEPLASTAQVSRQLRELERSTGKTFGGSDMPMLLSVQAESDIPLPGAVAPVQYIGLNDESVTGFATWSGNEDRAWASYCTLMASFGTSVLGIEPIRFARARVAAASANGAREVNTRHGRRLARMFQDIIADATGRPFPQDPREQLDLAVSAAFRTSAGILTRAYLARHDLSASRTASVSVRSMVFGDRGMDSGVGITCTRNPNTGSPGLYGTYAINARGEDLAQNAGSPRLLHDLEQRHPAAHRELAGAARALERHVLDICDIAFVIENGILWILEVRVGRRTASSAFRVAAALREEGLIDADEAVRRVTGDQLAQLMFTRFAENNDAQVITTGVGASPGAAVGHAVFDSTAAIRWADDGKPAILVRPETGPADLDGMVRATGVLTSRGGQTSHAAVIARGLGRTCVCGAVQLLIDTEARQFTTRDGLTVAEGELISIDGTSGRVYLGSIAIVPSPVIEYFEGRLDPASPDVEPLVRAVHGLMSRADSRRRLGVLANADTREDATRARRFGAEGIGLCRTEHMFLGGRKALIEQLIISDDDAERREALTHLLSLQRDGFIELLTAMDGLPVAVRLLDAPLHEFLPDLTQLAVRVALAETTGDVSANDRRLLRVIRRMHEVNPMLGLRGIRLGLVFPGLYETQVRAIGEAVADRLANGGRPHVKVILPMVGDSRELALARQSAEAVLSRIAAETGKPMPAVFGAMIELPRAALTAREIARHTDLFSFGTNDLTQTTWAMSRDDAETTFVAEYLAKGVFTRSPFETCDGDGVGRLMDIAARDGREVKSELELGVCGEHAGDPDSIHLFHRLGIDYVSCAPFQVPIARLEAGRAAIAEAPR